MSRTKLLNISGIAVGAVLVASWGVGVFLPSDSAHSAEGVGSKSPAATSSVSAPATGAPLTPQQRRRAHHRAAGATSPPPATVTPTGIREAVVAHKHAHHASSSSKGPRNTGPTPHLAPTPSATSPQPSPTQSGSSGNVVTQILDGLSHLGG